MIKGQKILALDFDGTLVECVYGGDLDKKEGKVAHPKFDVINAVRERVKQGWDVILWTCRNGAYLDEAVAFCKLHGIPLVAINDHHPAVKEACKELGYEPGPKVFAHEYWDDKAVTLKMISEEC